MMVTRLLATLATSVVFCAAALAQDDAHDHHDTHHEDEAHHADEDQTRASGSAHVHGAWTLFAALDDDLLSVTMTGPLQDVLGFESAPETPRQHAAVEAMLQDLSRADALIATDPGAQCEPSAPVDIGLPEDFNVPETAEHVDDQHDAQDDGHEDDHEDHGHDAHENAGHEGHEEGHDHEDEGHDHEDHDHDEHAEGADIDINLSYTCGKPGNIRTLAIEMFASYPSIETMDAVFLGDAGQVAARLTSQDRVFSTN